MSEIASITPRRIERLRPSDVQLIARHVGDAGAVSSVLASFLSFLTHVESPSASDLDDVACVALQLKAAGVWDRLNPADFLLAFRSYVDPSVSNEVVEAAGKAAGKDFNIIAETAKQIGLEPAMKDLLPEPVAGVAPPIFVDVVQEKKVAVVAGSQNTRRADNEESSLEYDQLHLKCLTAARELLNALEQGPPVRSAYTEAIKSYLEEFPSAAGQGNMLLADSEARSIRGLAEEDEDSLPTALIVRMHAFFEAHLAVCVYYDGVKQFYEHIKTGVLAPSLAEENVEAFVAAVAQSEEFIDAAVVEAFREVDRDLKRQEVIAVRIEAQKDVIPADPISLQPQRVWRYGVMSAMNAIYAAFRATKAPVDELSAWLTSGQALAATTAPALSQLGAAPRAQMASH